MTIHSIHGAHARRFSVAHSAEAAALASPHLAALSLIDVQAAAGGAHVGLPHDLFMVTAYCGEQLACRTAGDEGPLRVVVSALRTRPAHFDTRGEGQMAVALLTPLGLLRAFAYPLNDLSNRRVQLRELISAPAEAMLHGALLDAPPGAQRSRVFGRWLETRFSERRRLGWQAERVAAAAMSLLGAADTPIEALARQHALSRRQLERDFRRWLGVAPGAYARLVRFQRAAGAVADGQALAHVAADEGYADQAHMTRSFGETAGVTPRQVRDGARASAGLRAALAQRMVVLQSPAPAHAPAAAQAGQDAAFRLAA